MPVIVQPGFSIIVLAAKAQIVLHSGHDNIGLSKGQIIRGPDHLSIGIGHFLRCAQMIVMNYSAVFFRPRSPLFLIDALCVKELGQHYLVEGYKSTISCS